MATEVNQDIFAYSIEYHQMNLECCPSSIELFAIVKRRETAVICVTVTLEILMALKCFAIGITEL